MTPAVVREAFDMVDAALVAHVTNNNRRLSTPADVLADLVAALMYEGCDENAVDAASAVADLRVAAAGMVAAEEEAA